jgi:RraA family protein
MPYGYRVYQSVQPPLESLIERLRRWASADLSDAMSMAGTMDNGIKPAFLPITRVVGSAVTVSVPFGSQNVRKMAMQLAGPGNVLVINGRASLNSALLGSNLAFGLSKRGLAGVVADGAVRDVSELKRGGLPVFCRGVTTLAGPKEGPGEVNVPIACGGIVVNPGDIIVADEDGVVSVPQIEAEELLSAVEAAAKRLKKVMPQLRKGSVTNIANVEAQLRGSGCEFCGAPYRALS